MLIGLPGSGKSTYSQTLNNAKIISSDEYRKEILKDENNQKANSLIFDSMYKDVVKTLNNGIDVIYDATNIGNKRRKILLDKLKKDLKDIVFFECIVFATPFEQCVVNNLKRERKVPFDVIERMYKNFYIPNYQEGWNLISIKYWEKSLHTFVKTVVKEKPIIPQDNPNHSLDLFAHMDAAEEVAHKITDSEILHSAARLHDIGKVKTKTFFDSKGNPSEKAHYFNHENVGAYECLFILQESNFSTYQILKIANLIQYHMRPYSATTSKAKAKLLREISEDDYENLWLLHTCDEEAH